MKLEKLDKLRLFSVILISFALLFICISVSTNSWYKNEDAEGVTLLELGLWKLCVYDGSTTEPCTRLESNKEKVLGILMLWPRWLHLTKAFAFIAIAAGLLSIVASFIWFTCDERCRIISQCTAQLMCVCCFIAFGIFVVHMPENTPTTVYGYSFVLFVIAAILSLIATSIEVFINCKTKKKKPSFQFKNKASNPLVQKA